MKAKLLMALTAIAMLPTIAVMLEGVSAQDPINNPPLPGDTDNYPSRAGTGAPCPETNVGASAVSSFHVYTASGPLATGADFCMQDPDTGTVVTCFVTGVSDAVAQTDPAPLLNAAFNCDAEGILNTGTDGEFEWGLASANLNVRDGATSAGNGGGVSACLGPTQDPHHGAHTAIHVLDVTNSRPGFDVTADWSRGAVPGDGDCGDGTVEPCFFSGPPPATPPTPDPNNLPGTIGGTLDWVFHNLEATSGCNPLDYADHVNAGVGSWSATAAGFTDLSGVGSTAGYDGAASGALTVFVFTEVETSPAAGAGVAGWVWTN